MSNSPGLVNSVVIKDFKMKYIELISSGFTEHTALSELNFPKIYYIKLLLDDSDFARDVEEARKLRAEIWINSIVEDLQKDISSDDVPVHRLRFDKLTYLAKADNPDRYGNNSKKISVDLNMKQFKLLTPEQAMDALKSDPFAIDAECVTVVEEDLL